LAGPVPEAVAGLPWVEDSWAGELVERHDPVPWPGLPRLATRRRVDRNPADICGRGTPRRRSEAFYSLAAPAGCLKGSPASHNRAMLGALAGHAGRRNGLWGVRGRES
jgi:hypothetical protein